MQYHTSLRIKRVFNNLQASLWFMPSLIVVALMALTLLMVWLDRIIGYQTTREMTFFFSAGPEGTRDMLTTIASTMLTVASVAFSFTIVVFSFASSQYASRTLHSFIDDNTNQAVLGTLLRSFVYCLLVLRTVHLESGNEFVPVLSASVALLLAIVGLGPFILFIHHVADHPPPRSRGDPGLPYYLPGRPCYQPRYRYSLPQKPRYHNKHHRRRYRNNDI